MIWKLKRKFENNVSLKYVIRSSIILFTGRSLGLVITYIFTMFVTNKFGAKAWGIFTLCFTVLQITSMLGRFGMDISILRFIAQYNAEGKGRTSLYIYLLSLYIVVPSSIFITVSLYILSPVIAQVVFKEESLVQYIRMISIAILPMVLLYINIGVLKAWQKPKQYTLVQDLLPFTITLLIVFFYMWCLNSPNINIILSAYVFSILLASFISFVFVWLGFVNSTGGIEKFPIKKLFSSSLYMFASQVLFTVISWIDIIMIGIWKSEADVGIYNIALMLSSITNFTISIVGSIVAPKFVHLWTLRDLEGLKRLAVQASSLTFYSLFPILILYMAFPEWFMGLFGKEFTKGANALALLSIGGLISALVGPSTFILSMTGKMNMYLLLFFVSVIVNVILNYILIPKLGLTGASLASVICISFMKLASAFLVRYHYKFLPIARLM